MNEYDVIVIGSGVAGITVAIKCAYAGMKVALIENRHLGGRSLHGGGVFIHHVFQSLKVLEHSKYINASNIIGDASQFFVDYSNLISSYKIKKKTIEEGFLKDISNDQIDFIKGKAKLLSNHSAQANDEIFYAKHIVLANGGKLNIPNYPGLDQALESGFAIEPTEIENCFTQPKEVVIVGGGRISYELSYFYVAIGTKVTVISNSIVLHTFDQDIREA